MSDKVTSDKPFFSIVVPVYNVGKYLRECLDSILGQTFGKYEVILVDDKSTDSSGAICDKYAYGHKVAVYHRAENAGLAAARNLGLSYCLGEYVMFVDSDDFLLSPHALETIALKISAKNPDVLVFGFQKYFDKTKKWKKGFFHSLDDGLDTEGLIRTNAYKALAWNKVVRRSLIETYGLQFPSIRTSEDTIWCYELLKYTSHISLLPEELYAYRQREGSIISERNLCKQRENIENTLYSIKYCLEDLREYNPVRGAADKTLLYSYLAYEYSWLLGKVYPFWNAYKKDIRQLAFLLGYQESLKVKKVHLLYKVCGLRLTAFICHIYIDSGVKSPFVNLASS